MLIVWSESIDHIVPSCHDIEEKLIKLLWRSRPTRPASTNTSYAQHGQGNSAAPSIAEGSTEGLAPGGGSLRGVSRVGSAVGLGGRASGFNFFGDLSDQDGKERTEETKPSQATASSNKSFWKKIFCRTESKDRDLEALNPNRRPIMLYAPLYNGLAAGLSLGLYNACYGVLPLLTLLFSYHRDWYQSVS